MSENICPQCGAPISPGAVDCRFCGEKLPQSFGQQPMAQQPMMQQPYGQQPMMQQPYGQQPMMQQPYGQQPMMQQPAMYQNTGNPAINPAWPIKSKTVAGVLAILLGGLGIHKFYLGKIGMGILYLVFCWTYIPSIVGIVEGIIYLCSNDENFQLKNHVRIG